VTVTIIVRVRRPGITRSRLSRVIRHVLRREGAAPSSRLTVALVSDGQIRGLNRRFLGMDRPTDVLSFPAGGGDLGEVVVSVDRARVQARAAGHAVGSEIAFLAAHGALHLLGYRDTTPRTLAAMLRRQRALLREVGVQVIR
jgi:probable rRNA maturation factor